MKADFSAKQIAGPEIAAADGILRTCVRYGFCTAVCPTYVLTRDENEAPRGRIDLIRAMLEKGGRPDPKTVGHIDSCLSCNSCMTTCAVDVDYLHLSDIARAFIEANYRRPLDDRLMRGLITRTIPEPACFARMSRLARLVRPFRGLLPGARAPEQHLLQHRVVLVGRRQRAGRQAHLPGSQKSRRQVDIVALEDRIDDTGEPVQLEPPDRLRPPVSRRHRIAQHLLHRPVVDAEPASRLVMAQTLDDNRRRTAA